MQTLFDRILKSHWLWKDRPLSRRDFFTLLLPFKRKKCPLCQEDRPVSGPYCPTCSKRQLFSGKGVKVILFLALSLPALGVSTAGAFDFSVQPSSYVFFSKDRNVNSANQFYLPFYQYLDADLTKLWSPSVSIHVSGWGRGDFTSRGAGEDRGDGELLYGYFEWQDQKTPRRVLRVGRQFFFGGPTSLRSQYVDGLYFKSDIAKGFGAEVLGGSPVTSSIGGRGGDFTAQGRTYFVSENKAEVGVGYLNSRDSSERSREDVGLDYWFNLFGKVELYGNLVYDVIGRGVADLNVTSTYFPAERLKLTGNFGHAVPGNFLPHTSLFSVFSTSSYENLGLAGTYFLSERFTLDGDASWFHYSTGGDVFRFGGQGTCRYGEKGQGTVGLGFHRLDQIEGGVTEIRSFQTYRVGPKVSLSADLYGYLFDRENRGRDFSFTGIGGIGYEFVKDLRLVGSVFYSSNPFFNSEVRGLLKLVYTFGGTSNVF